MILNFTGEIFKEEELIDGINELSNNYSYQAIFNEPVEGFLLSASKTDEKKLTINAGENKIHIMFHQRNHFFRALGLVLEKLQNGEKEFLIEENIYFDKNGPMYDVSQGSAVIKIEVMKGYIRKIALMGLNMLMIYCEDSFDVEGEPYFGYMRARYSEAEMRELDEYADIFGIEMIPCIQVLGHLNEVLKWDVYKEIRDYHDCVLVGEDKTYDFLRNVIKSAIKPFKTKRIHVGMDEAWNLGQGKYLIRNGWVERSEIMKQHLERVMEILDELGCEPMMWSDMFLSDPQTNNYYDCKEVTQNRIDAKPDNIRLVYWDYYHADGEDFYLDYIDKHRLFGEPIFAGGIWTWEGFGPDWVQTAVTTNYALSACKKKNVREILATIWGDAGTECDVNATLFGLVLFGEHGFSEETPSEETLKRRFQFITGANYDDFKALHRVDHIGENPYEEHQHGNPSKFLMWQDILCGLFDKQIKDIPYDEHYRELSLYFKEALKRNGEYNSMMEFYYHLCHTLEIKSKIGINLCSAYRSGDKEALRELTYHTMPQLQDRVSELRKCHRRNFLKANKSIGWPIFDTRYSTLMGRIDTAMELLKMYLDGEIDSIMELEETRLDFVDREPLDISSNYYNRIAFSGRTSWPAITM